MISAAGSLKQCCSGAAAKCTDTILGHEERFVKLVLDLTGGRGWMTYTTQWASLPLMVPCCASKFAAIWWPLVGPQNVGATAELSND